MPASNRLSPPPFIGRRGSVPAIPQDIQIGRERFLVATVALSTEGEPPISLVVLKSLDHASAFLDNLYRVLLGLGLLSILAGSALVFLISDTFMRPLANLVGG